eukprot:7315761-Pyramimonas_sp.AAC.1
MWCKLWVARDVAQAMWMQTVRRNLCGAIYVVRVLVRKQCGARYALKAAAGVLHDTPCRDWNGRCQ